MAEGDESRAENGPDEPVETPNGGGEPNGGGGEPEHHGARDQRTEEDRRADEDLGPGQGLSSEEADERRERYGPNAVEEEEHSILRELLSHFWGPIPWMIEAAVVLTAATGRWADFGIILALLLMNGGVGFWEEHQAQSAIEALRERLAKKARVKRDGEWSTLDAAELVPGDLVAIERGSIVPADGLMVAGSCEADESALTGESLPVGKETGDSLFSSSTVARGGPQMRVIATGASTEFGRTAELAGEEGPTSHFQQAVISVGKYLIAIAGALVAWIVFVEAVLRGTGLTETLEFALVVTIASIPVALPAVLSVTMAVGARHLAKREAVVSHLPAVEEMSGVDILCADKTGTITQNELAVAEVAAISDGLDRDRILFDAGLTAEREGSDPIDRAILEEVDAERLDEFETLDFEPFDATRKRAESRVRGPDGELEVAKGAVQAILDIADADVEAADKVEEATESLAEKGFRALAVARSEEGRWLVEGVLGLQDPPREDSRETLEEAEKLGVEVKMVTGDRVEIGRQIAGEVGMGREVLGSEAIEALEGDQLALKVEEADGFAQVVPEDKYRIVEALQAHDHIVGMTGDGVNDVPALKRADAGIAVSGATDAARAAAEIVLLSPGLSVIIEAVHRAREVFRRMTNYAIYRITETIRIVLFVTLSIVVFAFFPVTPIQIVLLAILNDAAILTIAYDRVRPSSRPERWDLREVLTVATVLGLIGVVSSFTLVWIGHVPLDLLDAEVQTLLYLKLSVAGHLTLFVARTRERFWSYRPAWILLIAVVGTQILATFIAALGFLMEPLAWKYVALAWGYALIWLMVLDQAKLITYRVLERRGEAAEELQEA